MVELRETDTARVMLRTMKVFRRMQQDDPERFLRLDKLAGQCGPLGSKLQHHVLACACLCMLVHEPMCLSEHHNVFQFMNLANRDTQICLTTRASATCRKVIDVELPAGSTWT